MSWLLDAMKPKITWRYLFLRTAKEIYDAAFQTY